MHMGLATVTKTWQVMLIMEIVSMFVFKIVVFDIRSSTVLSRSIYQSNNHFR